MQNRARLRVPALVLAGAVGLAAACAPGSGSNDDDGDAKKSKSAEQIETDVSKAGEVTLTVWDQHTSGASNEALEELNSAFEKEYPNVTIDRVSRNFSDLKQTLQLAITDDDPPDVVQANQGYPDMGSFVSADLLEPMDSYAKVYEWTDAYPQTLLDLNSFSSDGQTWQGDTLYGLSQTGEIVGIFTNKQKMDELGLEPPKTFEDFERQLGEIEKAGELPIQFGSSDKSPTIHLLGVVLAAQAGADKARDLVTAQGDVAWDDPDVVRAIETIQRWNEAGYLTPGANGQTEAQATAAFGKGEGVFHINGTWAASAAEDGLGKDVGFMNPPPSADSGNSTSATLGGTGLAWSITSGSGNPDVAAAYIDWITNDDARDVVAEKGELPALEPPTVQREPGTVHAEIADSWTRIREDDGLVPYLDYTTPTFYDTLTGNMQQVIGGKLKPADAASALQDDFGKFTE